MNIISVTVLLSNIGCDKIVLDTDLPAAYWPYQGSTALIMDAARDTGIEYARKHFHCEPRVIDSRWE